MSDTPRTDAVHAELSRYKRNTGGDARTALNHARELERELSAVRAALRNLFGASKNEMVSRGLPLEWGPNSAMGRAEAALSAHVECVVQHDEGWTDEDKPLPEDGAIDAAHPVRTGEHSTYQEALRLVNAKRSKFALVGLVNWLLTQRAKNPSPSGQLTTEDSVRESGAMKAEPSGPVGLGPDVPSGVRSSDKTMCPPCDGMEFVTRATALLQSFCFGGHPIEGAERLLREFGKPATIDAPSVESKGLKNEG